MKVAVVTPTIGSEHLAQCIDSVQNQTYENLTHYIFLDGQEHFDKIQPALYDKVGKKTVKTITLEENIGKGWYGHRVYAACSFLVNADVICYLDQDNWFETNHVEALVKRIKEGNLDWAYSLRKIYDGSSKFLFDDNCESLGKWPMWRPSRFGTHHIDTSSFAIKRDVAVRIGHAWYGQYAADRQFFLNLSNQFPNYDCSYEHTLCYRLDGNEFSAQPGFFVEGNKFYHDTYNGVFPWKQKPIRQPDVYSSPGGQVTLVVT